MRLDRFDLNLLVTLDVLLEECNVTQAAARLHIEQSSCSAALARLRDYFADELLVPVARQLVRTPLGDSLVEPVRQVLGLARTTLARRPGFDPASAERRFVVCASDYAITVFLAAVAQRATAMAPGLRLDIRNPGRDVFDRFQRGEVDLLFMPELYLAASQAPRLELFRDTHVCLVCKDNPRVGPGLLTLDRYHELGHLAVRFGDEDSVAFEEWFLPRHGRQRRIEMTVHSFSMVPQLLPGTERIATVHRRQAAHFVRQHPVRMVEMPFDIPPLVELMAWPPHRMHDPAHQWLRQLVQDQVASMQCADDAAPHTPSDIGHET